MGDAALAQAGHEVGGGGSGLFRSKLRPPIAPEYFIPRPQFSALLDGIPARRLTLVVAPAGSGKSQVLANWVVNADVRTAWLSLEETDDDPVELWSGMIAALEQLAPTCGLDAHELLVGAAPIPDVVHVLLDRLEAHPVEPCVLIIDDVHVLKNQATAESLAMFVQHLPAWLHVVLVSRMDPRLPLDRMRVRGEVAELRFAQLQFSASETRLMLTRLAPDLTDTELDETATQSDGWAAGVQLAALAVRSAHVQSTPVTRRRDTQLLTNDYVWHEVLAAGDAEVIEVLLQISVVDRVNTSLAAAITGNPNAGALLLRGEAQGLFVHRIGSDGWFRIHGLVREVLLAELVRQSRDREHHERAARWLENAGEVVSALEQWLLAQRPREALRLVSSRSSMLYDSGHEAAIIRTIELIPRAVVAGDMSALIEVAVSLILVSRSKFFDAVLEAAWHAERSSDEYSGQIAALQSIALTVQGDWTQGGASARRALVELGESWWGDPAGRFAWNMVARSVALSESWDDADELVLDATIATSRDPERGLSLEGVRALGEALAGRPVDALSIAAGIRHAAASMSILRSELGIAEAIARREIGDRQRAFDELHEIADAPPDLRMYCTVAAMLELALAAADDGDPELASHELGRAQSLVSDEHGGPDLQEWIARVATVVALARGDVEDAERWSSTATDLFWGPIGRARVALAIGERSVAGDLAAAAAPRCVRHEVIQALLIARATPDLDEAGKAVEHAVELASSTGMLQTVASDGREVMEIIERAAWRVPGDWLDRLRLAAAHGRTPASATSQGFPEALTDRERDVLRLLPSRLTLNEIAKELYVSVNTLKFHLRVIYRKLNVKSRDEAAAVARSLTRVRPGPTD